VVPNHKARPNFRLAAAGVLQGRLRGLVPGVCMCGRIHYQIAHCGLQAKARRISSFSDLGRTNASEAATVVVFVYACARWRSEWRSELPGAATSFATARLRC
jgi:hypothetical protein